MLESDQKVTNKLERLGTLRWFHWVIVLASFALTLFAWSILDSQVKLRNKNRFEREASQVIELVVERMQKYEDALWGGVAYFQSNSKEVSYEAWKSYSKSLNIDSKYPGINGIGYIKSLTLEEVSSYVEEQRKKRPSFKVYPSHSQDVSYPIQYIEPEDINAKAVGLDMAHESNRFNASKKARDTGKATITGPIILVQDKEKTPGFLFFTPYYAKADLPTVEKRRDHFLGMVYAPFVVRKLMNGVLRKENRHVGIEISDEGTTLYSEMLEESEPDSMFQKRVKMDLYGRSWEFNIWTTSSFHQTATDHRPLVVLFGGAAIDLLFLFLFIVISSSSRKALDLAILRATDLEKSQRELKKTKRELQDFNVQLEGKVRKRTHALELAKNEAEHANKAKTTFLRNISHEIRTPMHAILSFSDMGSRKVDTAEPAKLEGYFSRIRQSCNRLLYLINNLLDISRLESGEIYITPSATSIHAVVNDVIAELSMLLDAKKIKIIKEFDDASPTMPVDKALIHRVLVNLLSNAESLSESEGAIIIRTRVVEEGEALHISVQDEGPGVPPEHLEEIFQPFKTAESQKERGSTGLGLAICREIVTLHGGKIWAQNNEEKGALFTFELPCSKAEVTGNAILQNVKK